MHKGISATLWLAIIIIGVEPSVTYAQGIMETGGLYGGTSGLAGHAAGLSNATRSAASYYGRRTTQPQAKGSSKNSKAKFSRMTREEAAEQSKMAITYYEQGQKEEKSGNITAAQNLYWQSLYIRQTIWGERDPLLAGLYDKIAELFIKQNRPKEAQSFYREYLALQARRYGPGAVELIPQLQKIAAICVKQNNYSDASSYYKEIMVLQAKKNGPKSSQFIEAQNNLIHAYIASAKYPEAENLLVNRLNEEEKSSSPNNAQMLSMLDSLADLYRKTNRTDEASQIEQKIQSIMTPAPSTANTSASSEAPKTLSDKEEIQNTPETTTK